MGILNGFFNQSAPRTAYTEFAHLSNSVTLPNTNYSLRGGSAEEFEYLRLLHSQFPNYFVKPIQLIQRKVGNSVQFGYEMEYLAGNSLGAIVNGGGKLTKSLLGNITHLFQKMHERNFVHGDLNAENIMISHSFPYGFKLIDPAALNPLILKNYFPQLIKHEQEQLGRLVGWLNDDNCLL